MGGLGWGGPALFFCGDFRPDVPRRLLQPRSTTLSSPVAAEDAPCTRRPGLEPRRAEMKKGQSMGLTLRYTRANGRETMFMFLEFAFFSLK